MVADRSGLLAKVLCF